MGENTCINLAIAYQLFSFTAERILKGIADNFAKLIEFSIAVAQFWIIIHKEF